MRQRASRLRGHPAHATGVSCLAALAALATGCTPPPEPEAASFAGPLISAEALADAAGRVLIVDSRPRAIYEAGHVPGAVSYDTDRVASRVARALDTMVRSRLTDALGALGLDDAVPVVVIDEGTRDGFARAAETCWHLALVSAAPCHIVEGGLDDWHAAGRELVTEAPPPREPREVVLTPRPRVFADLEWMRDAVYQGRPLIDVQATRDVPSIPGAWRAPLPRLVDDAGRVDRAAVASAVRLGDFERDSRRIVFGDARRDGAAGWFLFGPVSGLDGVRLFAGGMSQWWTVPDLPRTDTVGDASLGGLR